MTNNDSLPHKVIMVTPDSRLNDAQLSIKHRHCVKCKRNIDALSRDGMRIICGLHEGHSAWYCDDCNSRPITLEIDDNI